MTIFIFYNIQSSKSFHSHNYLLFPHGRILISSWPCIKKNLLRSKINILYIFFKKYKNKTSKKYFKNKSNILYKQYFLLVSCLYTYVWCANTGTGQVYCRNMICQWSHSSATIRLSYIDHCLSSGYYSCRHSIYVYITLLLWWWWNNALKSTRTIH